MLYLVKDISNTCCHMGYTVRSSRLRR